MVRSPSAVKIALRIILSELPWMVNFVLAIRFHRYNSSLDLSFSFLRLLCFLSSIFILFFFHACSNNQSPHGHQEASSSLSHLEQCFRVRFLWRVCGLSCSKQQNGKRRGRGTQLIFYCISFMQNDFLIFSFWSQCFYCCREQLKMFFQFNALVPVSGF